MGEKKHNGLPNILTTGITGRLDTHITSQNQVKLLYPDGAYTRSVIHEAHENMPAKRKNQETLLRSEEAPTLCIKDENGTSSSLHNPQMDQRKGVF